ncbi:TPA: hypothetical protein ACPV0E_001724 [Vibrio parahaemolyticus]
MSISEIAAWWGAIVASIVLIWDVYKWKTDGPMLNVLLAPNMKTFGDPERDDMTWVSITVTNVGSRPTTLKSVGMWYHKDRMSYWRKKVQHAAIFPNPNKQFPLPFVLKPGEEWIGLLPQDRLYEDIKDKSGCMTIWLSHSHSSKPVCNILVLPDSTKSNT